MVSEVPVVPAVQMLPVVPAVQALPAYRQKKRTVAIDRARTKFALKLQRLLEGIQNFRQVSNILFFDIRHPSPDIPHQALSTKH